MVNFRLQAVSRGEAEPGDLLDELNKSLQVLHNQHHNTRQSRRPASSSLDEGQGGGGGGTMRHVMRVQRQPGDTTFGLWVRTVPDTGEHIVTLVAPDSCAKDVLFSGDVLKAINGFDAASVDHPTLITILQQATAIDLEVERPANIQQETSTPVHIGMGEMASPKRDPGPVRIAVKSATPEADPKGPTIETSFISTHTADSGDDSTPPSTPRTGQNPEACSSASPVYAFEPESDNEQGPSPNAVIESDLQPVDVSFVDDPSEHHKKHHTKHHGKHHKKEAHIKHNDKPYSESAQMEIEAGDTLHQLELAQIVAEEVPASQANHNAFLHDDHAGHDGHDDDGSSDDNDDILCRSNTAMDADDPGDATAPMVPPRESEEEEEDSDLESEADSESDAENAEIQVAAASPAVSPAESKDSREFYVAELSRTGPHERYGIELSQREDKHVIHAVNSPKAVQQGITSQDELVEINVRQPASYPPRTPIQRPLFVGVLGV